MHVILRLGMHVILRLGMHVILRVNWSGTHLCTGQININVSTILLTATNQQNKFGTKNGPQNNMHSKPQNKFGTKNGLQNKFCTPRGRKITGTKARKITGTKIGIGRIPKKRVFIYLKLFGNR
ncbi:MAG: hypothetical protein DRR16_00390 [Candidatus Parabeggiatoa sp. nov. 3]|jgi:hypothetical protein|nr:MAG: hypothetical protein DRR00_01485 [Gammaproteobacteria bacterium]RKZ66246.1 MAG: hypothetical protein DRQ99_10285 [Gammaproteobacteria bacterium]RKZ90159.1 MAG: hypothetical protein DRR16_00390 [Gammaproteobacteria bacterium]